MHHLSPRIRTGFRRSIVVIAWAGVLVAAALAGRPIVGRDLERETRALEFVDRSGLPLGTLLSRDHERTVSVPLASISPWFRAAIVDTEDRRFLRHGALDAIALARAVAELVRERRVVSGASTIEMQLARLLAPTAGGVRGKLAAMLDAERLERGMSKGEILAAYCNRLPFGSNIFGIEAAARSYFGVSAAELDLAQASLLAALPNDPTRLDPYDNPSGARARQRLVLGRMVRAGHLTPEAAASAMREHLAFAPRNRGIFAAAHFLFWLAPQAPAAASRVVTTLDRPLQRFVEAQAGQVLASLAPFNVHDAAALVVDNHTGAIVAYLGSPDYFAAQRLGRNDGVQALRQPGSTLKPFLYEYALERRTVRPTTILDDAPAAYALPGARVYAPQDYSGRFEGPVRVRIALADSLNVPAVRVLERVGVPSFLERLHALGFTHLRHEPSFYGLGLTLGAGEVSLFELAQAYVRLARGGSPVAIHGIGAPADARSSPHLLTPPQLPPDPSWALITDMLADAHARARSFGVDSILALPFPAAVKTGTSSDFRDTWTVGFSRDFTVAVWMGNFDGSPMRTISGVTGAAPLWNRIMLHLHERREPARFARPAGYVDRPICATTGRPPGRGCPAVVDELLDGGDRLAYAAATRAPEAPAAGPAILSPHDGDVFVAAPAPPGSAVRQSQQLRFAAADASTGARWTLNGAPAGDGPAVFWPVEPGSWTLRLRQRARTRSIHFTVLVAGAQRQRRGFSNRS